VLRNFFDSGVSWGDVFNRLLVLWVAIFAATIAVKENRHLSFEGISKYVPKKMKPTFDLLQSLFGITVTTLLTRAAWLFFKDQIQFESSDLLFEGLPKAYFTIIFPVGFGLMTLRYFLKVVEDFYKIFAGEKSKEVIPEEDDELELSVKVRGSNVPGF
jgi:TRAP-type C4-dicarboxylate transport system permease small subunit